MARLNDQVCRLVRGTSLALTDVLRIGNLGNMAFSAQRPDPERRLRRLELLAALADAKSVRERAQPSRLPGARLSRLIAARRRWVN